MSSIAIVATLTAKSGKEKEAENVLLEVLKHSRNEEGCIHYNLHQSQEDPKSFTLYELWNDQKAIESHMESPHYQTYRANIEPLVDSRVVQRLNLIS